MRIRNIINRARVVKFADLKAFITEEREETISGMAQKCHYDKATFSNTLAGRRKNLSAVMIMHYLEWHFGIRIEGDPYR